MTNTTKNTKTVHPTREAWLLALVESVRPWFADAGAPLPKAVRISVGFSSKGARSNVIGQCWDPSADEHGISHIFVHPMLNDLTIVVAAVVHELVHAAVGCAAKHGKDFRRPAMALGLEGKMTATVASEELTERLKPIIKDLGSYPHGALAGGTSSGKPKQTTRMLKCECAKCGYVVRTTAKWLDEVGAPICPADMVSMEAV